MRDDPPARRRIPGPDGEGAPSGWRDDKAPLPRASDAECARSRRGGRGWGGGSLRLRRGRPGIAESASRRTPSPTPPPVGRPTLTSDAERGRGALSGRHGDKPLSLAPRAAGVHGLAAGGGAGEGAACDWGGGSLRLRRGRPGIAESASRRTPSPTPPPVGRPTLTSDAERGRGALSGRHGDKPLSLAPRAAGVHGLAAGGGAGEGAARNARGGGAKCERGRRELREGAARHHRFSCEARPGWPRGRPRYCRGPRCSRTG